MKLFFSPNACSLGIHVLLEEIGEPFELQRLDFSKDEQFSAEYVAINPKSKVPALVRDDGTLLTEFPAIAFYLARAYPGAKLLPEGLEAEVKALELLDYLVATVHMRGFTRMFRPDRFSAVAAEHGQVRETGRKIVRQGLAILEPQFAGRDYIFGGFSIVDAALFFLENWAVHSGKIELPAVFAGHLQRLRARPAVQRALAAEGLA